MKRANTAVFCSSKHIFDILHPVNIPLFAHHHLSEWQILLSFFVKKNARSEVYGTDQHILRTLQGMNVMHLSLSSQHKSTEQKVMCMFYWGLWFSCWVSGLLPILQIALIKYSRNLLVYTSTLSLSYCSGEKGVGIKILDCMWRIKGTGEQTQNNRNLHFSLNYDHYPEPGIAKEKKRGNI